MHILAPRGKGRKAIVDAMGMMKRRAGRAGLIVPSSARRRGVFGDGGLAKTQPDLLQLRFANLPRQNWRRCSHCRKAVHQVDYARLAISYSHPAPPSGGYDRLESHGEPIALQSDMIDTLTNTSQKLKRRRISIEAKFVWLAAGGFAIAVWWLISDREPTQKEMTFAYRKHAVSAYGSNNARDAVAFRNRLHEIELIKDSCQKLEPRRYLCSANVLLNGQPLEGTLASRNAFYSRDAKGWRYEREAR